MIGLDDIYKVVVAMSPLYFALLLGYGSVRWWHIFNPDQCNAINQLVSYFTLPLFTLEFTLKADPFKWNYRFIGGDAISKLIILIVLALWAKLSTKGSYCWSITSFSLSTLTSSLVVGLPLIKAMYGSHAGDLVVQSSVIQSILWMTVFLFVLELRRARSEVSLSSTSTIIAPETIHVVSVETEDNKNIESFEVVTTSRSSFLCLMKVVFVKLAFNPNSYVSIIGVIWALLSNRWNFKMPSIIEDSIKIMSNAGTGTAMFSMGLFMAQQENLISCGKSLAVFSMVLKFIAGPAAMAVGCIVVGLRGDLLRIAIIQAALPQAITAFIFAKEYNLHADVLSTAVVFGMIISLPVAIGYYAALALLP